MRADIFRKREVEKAEEDFKEIGGEPGIYHGKPTRYCPACGRDNLDPVEFSYAPSALRCYGCHRHGPPSLRRDMRVEINGVTL
jgi:hypothetical protein